MLRGLLKYVYSIYSLMVVKLTSAGKRLDARFGIITPVIIRNTGFLDVCPSMEARYSYDSLIMEDCMCEHTGCGFEASCICSERVQAQ